eukprot:1151581-Pelagomonas_calceolata.AAC.3
MVDEGAGQRKSAVIGCGSHLGWLGGCADSQMVLKNGMSGDLSPEDSWRTIASANSRTLPCAGPQAFALGPAGVRSSTRMTQCSCLSEGGSGPLHDQPGTLKLRVPVQPFGLIPWDVVAFPGANGTTTLVASVHRIL